MRINKTLSILVLVVLMSTLFVGIALAGTPPSIPTKPTGGGGGSGGGGGGGGSYTPPAATPTPTPTPVPPYRLDAPLPTKVDLGNAPVRIEGRNVTVPFGYMFSEVIPNNTFEVPLGMVDGGTGKLTITVEPTGSQAGTITSATLTTNKTLRSGDQEIGVTVEVDLANIPASSSFDFDLLSPDSVDVDKVNEQLSAYSDKSFNTTPLLVFQATKNGLQNGRDIKNVKLTFSVPRPDNFDPAASYYVIRENDGAYDLLNATLVSSPDANPLVFEVVSPRGLSTFSLVAEANLSPTSIPLSASPTPVAVQSPTPAGSEGGFSSIVLLLGAFAAGAIAGVAAIIFVLWIRVR